MPKKNILALDHANSPWSDFLKEYFEDTDSTLHLCPHAARANAVFDRTPVHMVFANPALFNRTLIQKLTVKQQSHPDFFVFQIASSGQGSGAGLSFRAVFDGDPDPDEFQKRLMESLTFPDTLRLVLVDDEPEIGHLFLDLLQKRVNPSFSLKYTDDGRIALKWMEAEKPDVLILDVRMPAMDGREVYRQIKQKGWKVPVLIFFDAVSGDEVTELKRIGAPVIVEKGAGQSVMPELLLLIMKMVYFG